MLICNYRVWASIVRLLTCGAIRIRHISYGQNTFPYSLNLILIISFNCGVSLFVLLQVEINNKQNVEKIVRMRVNGSLESYLLLYGEQRWMQLGGYGGSMKGTNVKTNTWGENIEKKGGKIEVEEGEVFKYEWFLNRKRDIINRERENLSN